MVEPLRLSKMYMPTLKEDPSDAEIASHKLLLRSGMIRKTASGIYTFLPLGYRVLRKIEGIVRQEMDATGALEIMMPALQPAELWLESGRWNDYGPELMRLNDRHEHGFCLGPTHEELITSLIKDELRSYKQLPITLYQIQVKFRDEIRPRFGLLRSREFIMKDAYSFHSSQESLQETYDAMSVAYGNICDRCSLEWRPVEADSGQIGGSTSIEFMALADSGEAELVYCECGYSANNEAGACIASPKGCGKDDLEKISTPGIHTIEELAEFTGLEPCALVKALCVRDEEGRNYAIFVPGDHELNDIKANRVVDGFQFMTDEEMESIGLPKGSIGPVGLPDGITVIADASLKDVDSWAVGANEDGFHYLGAKPGRDFEVDIWEDLCIVMPNDKCPECGRPLKGARGIEVSQVFQLGDKYSKTMGATYLDENGKEVPFIMGCYGVGVTRTMAAVVEQHNDEDGIIWPANLAPAQVCVMPLDMGNETVAEFTERAASGFAKFGFEVAVDDRDERAGVKFADADLIGWPLQVIVGKRSAQEGNVEIKLRETGERKTVSMEALADIFAVANGKMSEGDIEGFDFSVLFD